MPTPTIGRRSLRGNTSMQPENLQAWALLDALTSNWSDIALRIGTLSPGLAADLERVCDVLDSEEAVARVAVIVDELLDVVLGTPAEPYVRELIARHVLTPGDVERGTSARVVASEATPGELSDFQLQLRREFGSTLLADSSEVGIPVYYATNRARDASAAGGYGGGLGAAVGWGRVRWSCPRITGHGLFAM